MRSSLLVAALIGLAATVPARDAVPESSLKAVTTADIAHLTKSLETGKVEKRAVNTVKATAMLVALAAQKGGNGGLQAQALAVADAVGKKDYAAAKDAAAKLDKASGGSAKAGDLAAAHKFTLDELMSIFRKNTVGGLNMEADIRAQGKKLTDPKLAEVLGARTALAAVYTAALPPSDADAGKKKQWDAWSKEMGDLGTAVAAEAGKGAKADKATVEKKLKALDANCTACHNVFRN